MARRLRGGRAKRRPKRGQAKGLMAALARGLVVPVVVAEGLDRYLRVVVAAAAPGEEAAPVPELARGWARAREVEGRDETEVVRRPRCRGQLLLAVDDT